MAVLVVLVSRHRSSRNIEANGHKVTYTLKVVVGPNYNNHPGLRPVGRRHPKKE